MQGGMENCTAWPAVEPAIPDSLSSHRSSVVPLFCSSSSSSLKTNDCLRAIDMQLGTPINSFVIMARFCTRAINEERLAHARDNYFRVWFDTKWSAFTMECRIQIYKMAVRTRAPRAEKKERHMERGPLAFSLSLSLRSDLSCFPLFSQLAFARWWHRAHLLL